MPGGVSALRHPWLHGRSDETSYSRIRQEGVRQHRAAAADDFNWRDLVRKTAVIAIENRTAKAQPLTLSLGEFGSLTSITPPS